VRGAGPPTGNEPINRKRTAHCRNEASVIASDLEAEEEHGVFLPFGA
jgi:hypothetical protein